MDGTAALLSEALPLKKLPPAMMAFTTVESSTEIGAKEPPAGAPFPPCRAQPFSL